MNNLNQIIQDIIHRGGTLRDSMNALADELLTPVASLKITAEQIIDSMCNDPNMWATHGMPPEHKLKRLETEITAALMSYRAKTLLLENEAHKLWEAYNLYAATGSAGGMFERHMWPSIKAIRELTQYRNEVVVPTRKPRARIEAERIETPPPAKRPRVRLDDTPVKLERARL